MLDNFSGVIFMSCTLYHWLNSCISISHLVHKDSMVRNGAFYSVQFLSGIVKLEEMGKYTIFKLLEVSSVTEIRNIFLETSRTGETVEKKTATITR